MKRLGWILVSILAFLTWPVQAQEVPTLARLEIDLRPEYDRPDVLIIYRGQLAPDTPLPVLLEIQIPAQVEAPTAVAYWGDDGSLLNQPHTTRVEGDRLVVSFELASLGFQLEYYDALPVDDGGRREYAFTYKADYGISELNLVFQIPPTSEGFVLDPPADSEEVIEGLAYQLVNVGAVEQGEERSWMFAYQKDNSDLAISALVQPEAPPEEEDISTMVIFLIAFVAVIAVGATAFWLGRRTQPLPQAAPWEPARRERRGTGRPSPGSVDAEVQFCYRCGTKVRHGSDFCHKCGAAVRKE
jgi:hypothetical protein